MRKIKRIPPPDCLNNGIEKSKRKNIGFYEKLRDSNGNVRPRWNTTCKKGEKVSKIRTTLLEMSNDSCVFCGLRIDNPNLTVDHYLPLSNFPYLAYCWENLLPTCKNCNQNVKGDFTPNSLAHKKVVEKIVSDKFEHDYVYDKAHLLTEIARADRLIDPTFDDPDEHLTFNPEFYFYEGKTRIGKLTEKKFFNRKRKEIAEKWESISLFIKKLVLDDASEDRIYHFISLYGYEYVCLKFYEHWLNKKQAGRINA